ncbi:MAG: DUF4321 domain-containing protein [Clostridia bacterium]
MKKVMIVIFTILGMIVGVVIGEATSTISYLKWLSIGGQIGIKTPITIDLSFLQFTVGVWCKISVCGVIFMVIFAFLSKQICKWLKI